MYKVISLLIAGGVAAAAAGAARLAHAETPQPAANSGIIRVKSAYSESETVQRIEKSVTDKGIRFFDDINQQDLAAGAGITLRPSHLLVFGNPPLGIKFLTSNPYAGLDWPVRMLVTQDDDGQVWIAYTDFDWIAHRHNITDRGADFKMASMVAASVAASAEAP
jgi:uncharacterized protein (DUF302 family)